MAAKMYSIEMSKKDHKLLKLNWYKTALCGILNHWKWSSNDEFEKKTEKDNRNNTVQKTFQIQFSCKKKTMYDDYLKNKLQVWDPLWLKSKQNLTTTNENMNKQSFAQKVLGHFIKPNELLFFYFNLFPSPFHAIPFNLRFLLAFKILEVWNG